MPEIVYAPNMSTAELNALRDRLLGQHPGSTPADVAAAEEECLARLSTMPLMERVTFARTMAKVRSLPRAVTTRLMADLPMVVNTFLASAEALTTEDLVSCAASDKESVVLGVARRANLPVAVTDALVGRNNPRVLRALAENTSAKLSDRTFDKLIECAVSDPSMDEVLSKRTDIPPAMAKKLFRVLTDASRQRVGGMVAKAVAPKPVKFLKY